MQHALKLCNELLLRLAAAPLVRARNHWGPDSPLTNLGGLVPAGVCHEEFGGVAIRSSQPSIDLHARDAQRLSHLPKEPRPSVPPAVLSTLSIFTAESCCGSLQRLRAEKELVLSIVPPKLRLSSWQKTTSYVPPLRRGHTRQGAEQ